MSSLRTTAAGVARRLIATMRIQSHKDEFDPVELIRRFNREEIRYILIGRQAVIQYGSPLFSFDYDFWVHPGDRTITGRIIESFGLIGKYPAQDDRPINTFADDEGNKVDIFCVREMSQVEKGISLHFDEVFAAPAVKADPNSDFFVRIPSIENLILLKQLGEPRPKDLEDIEYLNALVDDSRDN